MRLNIAKLSGIRTISYYHYGDGMCFNTAEVSGITITAVLRVVNITVSCVFIIVKAFLC